MINKVYVSTSNASLIQSAQTIAISSLGFLWGMGPVNLMRTVQLVPSSKWAWMVLDGNSGNISTTNKGPDTSNKTIKVATSISDVTSTFTPTPPLESPPPFVLSLTTLINDETVISVSDVAPFLAVFIGTYNYNGTGLVTGSWNLGDGTRPILYPITDSISHVYGTGSWTASLSLTESLGGVSSSAVVYISASLPTLHPSGAAFGVSGSVPGYSVTFRDYSTTNISDYDSLYYEWVFGDGNNVSGDYPPETDTTHAYTTEDSFIVLLNLSESAYGVRATYVLPGGVTSSASPPPP